MEFLFENIISYILAFLRAVFVEFGKNLILYKKFTKPKDEENLKE